MINSRNLELVTLDRLRSVAQLGKQRPHGHKMRYMAGCRCARCKKANALYERQLEQNRRIWGPNDVVPCAAVREHLLWLSTKGVGYKAVAKAVGVGKTNLGKVLWYKKNGIRRRTANAVLALQPSLDLMGKSVNVDAAETQANILQILKWGIPRHHVATDGLGNLKRPGGERTGLQVACVKGKRSTTTVRTAIRIRDFYARVIRMREIWVSLHGPIPRRHYVYWKPGRDGMTVRSFELRPFAVTYDYNNLWPQELKELSKLAKKVDRIRIDKKKEHAA